MASFNSNRGQERYRKGQKYHKMIHDFLKQRGWSFADHATPEEDMQGIDYWWELPKKMYPWWPSKTWFLSGLDYKCMFGDRLGVQTRMKSGTNDGYVFARIFPKKKFVKVYYIKKQHFWNHPRLRIDVNRDGEEYAYIHIKYVSTRNFYGVGGFYFD